MKFYDYDEQISEINVTPFVDVLLLLLIVFMIAAPVITKDIKISLPEENLEKTVSSAKRDFIISLDNRNRIYYENKRKKKSELKKDLQAYQKKGGNQIFIRADKKLAYGEIISLMAFVQNLGFENIGLLVQEK